MHEYLQAVHCDDAARCDLREQRSGCVSLEEKKLSISPPALDAPAWKEGRVRHGLRNDKEYKYWLVDKKGGVYSWKDSYGKYDRDCPWFAAGNQFSPSLKWKDCRR